ncbi:MAG TPA: insulinase family protein [Allosphingosinicella sp.]|jgi:zinc protease
MTKMKLLVATGMVWALAAATLTSPAAAQSASAPAAAAAGLEADPAVRMGTLPNGMRYQIRKNATPPNNASIRLRFDVGSMYEREDQRGLAHFIEHMVLNGTKNVPEGEFVRRLERAGLKFGPDTNASTDFEQTIYMLDLPKTDAETVDTALFLLREVAGEASFAASAIESERGILLSEERTRATPQLRNAEDELGYLLKGDILPQRLPIGLTEVLKKAPRERLVEFYDAYYRPERATLIAVGDFDVDAMEKKIRAQFGDWKGRGKVGAELPAPQLAKRGPESHVFVEPGVATRVSLSWVSPPDLRADSRATRIAELVPDLGLRVLNRRLERLAASGAEAPFIAAGTGRQEQAERAQITQVIAIAKPGAWQPALAAIEQEQRRLLQFGVTQAELDREIAEMRAAFTASAEGAATRPSPALAQSMLAALNDEQVFTTPAANLALFEDAVRGLKAEQVSAATKALFAGSGPLVYLTSPTAVEGGEPALLAAYQASAKSPVAAGAAQQAAAWPYTSFGTPGTVAERREMASLGATAIRFANGVRLTVKPTQFRDDEILVTVRMGNGQIDVPAADPAPAFILANGAFALGGLGKMSYEDLQEALASRTYGANFGLAEDAFVLSGKTRPQDLAIQMQVLAAFTADPGLRASGWDRLRAFGGTIHDQLESTPAGVAGRDAGALLHGGDRRWAFPSREEIAKADLAAGKALLGKPLQSGPLEIIVVGDVTVDEAVKQVAATFGALPARQDMPVAPAALRTRFPAPATVRLTHGGRADQGLAMIAWPTTGFYKDQKQTRTLNLLSEVLQLRLIDEIREKQGTTYSPDASHTGSETFPDYGTMTAQIEAPPEKLGTFLSDAAKIAADLRAKPITDDELQRARKPLVESITRQRASNEWWLNELSRVQTRPEAVQSIEQGLAQYNAITAKDLQKAAQLYLVDSKAWKLEVLPAAAK